jgi:hypothetical protein
MSKNLCLLGLASVTLAATTFINVSSSRADVVCITAPCPGEIKEPIKNNFSITGTGYKNSKVSLRTTDGGSTTIEIDKNGYISGSSTSAAPILSPSQLAPAEKTNSLQGP